MNILGISCYYHDSAASIICDSNVIAAAQEERFTRKKHDNNFPNNAIQYCLKAANISMQQVDAVAFYEKPILKFERLLYQNIAYFPKTYPLFISSTPSWLTKKLRIPKSLKKLGYTKEIYFIEHHLTHAANAYLLSPYDEATIVTADGVGEWTTTSIGVGKGTTIELLKEIKFPHSIGMLYSTITAYLGMTVNNSEYKCLHPATNVLLSNGKLIKIEDLYTLEGKKIRLSDSEEILKLKSKIDIVSLNKDTLKLCPSKTEIIYRKIVNTELYEVELLSGRKVIVTPNHKFTTITSFAQITTIEAKNLEKLDFVAIPKKLVTLEKHKGISKEWAKLLAYSISEGHELRRKEKHEAEIRIGTGSLTIFEDIKETVKKIGKKYRTWKVKNKKSMYYIGISVWRDLNFLKNLGYDFGRRAGTKKIPESIICSDKKIKRTFLSTLFDCDGGFSGHQVIYTTKSKELTDQLSYLLLGFGIHSRIRKVLNKKYNEYYYRIEINGVHLKEFNEKIGFNLKEKSEKLNKYISKIKKFGNNVEFAPIGDYILKKWLASKYYKKDLYKKIRYHFWDYETKKRYPTYRLLKRINEILKDDKITNVIESDLYFDRVKSIKKIHFNGYVYDVVVPRNHTFIGGFGGIILHNTMGLSAYGKKEENTYYHLLKKVVDIAKDGSYSLDMTYFSYTHASRMPSKKLCTLLGGNIRKPTEPLTQRHYDIAAAVQLITEELMIGILNYAYSLTQCSTIVLCGGVALNSVCNGKILSNTPFENIWIPPDPTDGGSSLGAAAFTYSCILQKGRTKPLLSSYLGPSFTDQEIQTYLTENHIAYELLTPTEHIQKVADLLAQNKIVAHFEGRMEWGPRALGNRSILANPTNPNMKNILNLKVKFREEFRPFAPIICAKDAPTYFDCDTPLPQCTDNMLMVYPIKKKYHTQLPAVTHVDGTGRLQTVSYEQHPFMYTLLEAIKQRTGVPILVNTSFNIRGEPIVNTPKDAYLCMMGTEIDYLSMGNVLISRDKNLKDAWNSESLAND